MVSSEVWMGSGTSVTFVPESELFLGYMPYGPTLGRTGTNKAHLIKYSLGYAVDGSGVDIENNHGEGTPANEHFTDFYHLVPDLYTGCIAKFYAEKDASGSTYDLLYTAIVAGNDADAIYFAGNIADFDSLHNPVDAQISTTFPRGYIVLESHGAVVPAPVALETRNSGSIAAWASAGEHIQLASAGDGSTEDLKIGDIIYNQAGLEAGKIWHMGASATLISTAMTEGSHAYIHSMSADLGEADSPTKAANDIWTVPVDGLSDGRTSLEGVFTAGDWVSFYASDDATAATTLGIVINMNTAGTTLYVRDANATITDDDSVYWGRDLTAAGTSLMTVKPRTLSDTWLGLADAITVPEVTIETKPLNMGIAGSRNVGYQYRGLESVGNASLGMPVISGHWLHYALGTTAVTSPSVTDTTDMANNFKGATAATNIVWIGYDNSNSSDGSQNNKVHRIIKGSDALCPPVLPSHGASPVATYPAVASGVATNTFTYTFSERNDNFLPSFALELVSQKGSTVADEPMVDRNTYNQTCYAQLFPGCQVNSFNLTAMDSEEAKMTIDCHVKRAFEAPNGYVGRCYDATNNLTNEFKSMFNFSGLKGSAAGVTQEFITPFFFSDGTISLFGQEFMKVTSFNLTIANALTDKRYVGNYNKQIKAAVPAQRTYEISMEAQVTDRRIFDELRNETPRRFALGDARIQLLLTKDNGERIKLQFDDYLIASTSWPLAEDRGPVTVNFMITPLRVNTIDATSGSALQQ
tara:strand:- start:5320 stop:7578 length:2259 start_codon:yes stop_codon:yes gene_type:complete